MTTWLLIRAGRLQRNEFGIMNLKEVGNWWCWTFLAEAFLDHTRRCLEGDRKVAWMTRSDIDVRFTNNSPSSSPGCSTRPNIDIQWLAFCVISSEEKKDPCFQPEVLWIASTAGDCVLVCTCSTLTPGEHSAAGVEWNLFGRSDMCVLCQTTHSSVQERGHKLGIPEFSLRLKTGKICRKYFYWVATALIIDYHWSRIVVFPL